MDINYRASRVGAFRELVRITDRILTPDQRCNVGLYPRWLIRLHMSFLSRSHCFNRLSVPIPREDLTVLFFFYSLLSSRYIYFARIHLQKIIHQLHSIG